MSNKDIDAHPVKEHLFGRNRMSNTTTKNICSSSGSMTDIPPRTYVKDQGTATLKFKGLFITGLGSNPFLGITSQALSMLCMTARTFIKMDASSI